MVASGALTFDTRVRMSREAIRSPLRHLDADAVSAAAKAESRNREVHLPPISTFRWWARRTESVNGAIIDAFSRDRPDRLTIVDPFAGGGTIPLAAAIRGHRVYAQDLNPWAAAGMAAMIGPPSPTDLRDAAVALEELAAPTLASAYSTIMADGQPGTIAHTLRVMARTCECGQVQRIYPHALVTLLVRKERRKPAAFLACRRGHLFLGEAGSRARCAECSDLVTSSDDYTVNRRVACPDCGAHESLSAIAQREGLRWEVALVERTRDRGRELSIPTVAEIDQATGPQWSADADLGAIPEGQETRVLLRHGFSDWADLYPSRQLAVTERLLQFSAQATDDERILRSLRLAIVGSAEMAGHLSRWDRWYLKSYESMAGHRFNLTTFSAEPNVWGTSSAGRGTVSRRLRTMEKAANWMIQRAGTLNVTGPVSASGRRRAMPLRIDVQVVEGSSERLLLPDRSVDLVLTDPPYHDDVQYSELSLPLRAWAEHSTHPLDGEAVVNLATGQNTGDDTYRALLASIFSECRRVLKIDGHLIFSYANREPNAWADLFEALQDAGFKAVGYAVVHSENETDVSKRNGRACTRDVILDLVSSDNVRLVDRFSSPLEPDPEGEFLHEVGGGLLRIAELPAGWRDDFVAALRSTRWLRAG